jgi:hypothetical protein
MEVQNAIDLIDDFLKPMRARAQKEAAADDSVSFRDTDAGKIENMEKQDSIGASTEQHSLGTDQTDAAKDSGSNVDSVNENNESDGEKFPDDQGTQYLSTDDQVKTEGNIGPMRSQEITQEQKMARAENLGNAILGIIKSAYDEGAEDTKKENRDGEAYGSDEDDVNAQDKMENGRTTEKAAARGGRGVHGDQYAKSPSTEAPDMVKTAAEQELEKYAAIAQHNAEEYYYGFLNGMLKRAQDEAEVAASVPAEVLQKVGGVSALLDKVAMEYPEAVLPEGEGGGMDMAAEAAPAPEAAPAEAAPAEGGGDLDALAAELEAQGVSPEELEQAITDVQALTEAGVSPEELGQALTELGAEGEAAGAPVADAGAAEGDMDYSKEAAAYAHRERVDAVKQFLRA